MHAGLGRRLSGEAGQAAVGLTVVLPLVLGLIMLVVQFALLYHSKQVVDAAATNGAREAALLEASADQGRQVARRFVAQSANLTRVAVQADRGPEQARVEVSGQAPQLVPWFSWTVTGQAIVPVERYVRETP